MGERYDSAVTIYSPDGHLLQVEYAQEAVRKGSTAVGLRTDDCILLGVERKMPGDLQEERSIRKIRLLDDHVIMTFAGLTADARIVCNRAQVEAQSHRLNFERPVSVDYMSRYVAELQQKYTQSNGCRPFGISCLIGGFDDNGKPHLYQTEPSGICYEWIAAATGRYGQTVRGFMEKHSDGMGKSLDEETAIKEVIRTMITVTPMGQSQFDVAVLKYDQPLRMVDRQIIADYARVIEKQNELEARQAQQLNNLTQS
ncbi:uncharacterized protein Dwil_GK19681 [Drosophila willistoni]|uniref:Proteasome subunit alpha type n=1 Tax=Drosophila willistoni TaxID=7260 RepID=B4MP19_DROWI|nr:proteasome subunit alpha type-7-1B [Drosophila willistoni]EDW73858.1 uncharacterized protein Dwil_GK19681 [Drosophila willistoni]